MYRKILVPVDISTEHTTEHLCQTVNDLAEKYQSQVRLICVMPGFGMPLVASYFPPDAQKKLKAELMNKLEALASKHFSQLPSLELAQGKRVAEVLKEIDRFQPDLVAVGCRRKKSRKNQRYLGSFSSGLSDRATCSVLIVR